MKFSVGLFIFALTICQSNSLKLNGNMTTTVELIKAYGYPVEVHTVETVDGYLLEMHRIPPRVTNGRNPEIENRRKFPVFHANSLFGSSAEIVLPGPGRALPFLLSDMGFDVWLGNFRGNTYSRAHKFLSPRDKRFWDFSWHESGIYDLPAQIDYVLNATKREKVILTAYSMGATTYFVMASTLPEYNDKVEMAFLMGPVGYMKDIKSPFLRFIIPFFKFHKVMEDFFGNGEFLRHTKSFEEFLNLTCTMNRVEKKLCSLTFPLMGTDHKEIDQDLLAFYWRFYPAGYSIKGAHHYLQLVLSGKFRQYDYGRMRNRRLYNSASPPEYNLRAITAPTYFYVGVNDLVGDLKDVFRLARQIPGWKKFQLVLYPEFNHLDFILARHAKELVYDLIIQEIENHLSKKIQ